MQFPVRLYAGLFALLLGASSERLTYANDGLRTVALSGTIDSVTSQTFQGLATNPAFLESGELLFTGALSGTAANGSSNGAIWLRQGNGTSAILGRIGDAAPGTSATLRAFSSVRRTVGGETAFTATLTGPGVAGTNNSGLWAGPSGNVELMVRTGDPAPSTSGVFRSVSSPVIASDSRIVFSATLRDAVGEDGVWRVDSGQLTPVALELTPAPGASDLFGTLNGHTVNSAGRIALLASFSDIVNNGYGVWSEGSSDGLKLVAKKGDSAPGTSGNFETFHLPFLHDDGHVSFVGEMEIGGGVVGTNNNGIWSDRRGAGLQLEYRAGVSRDPQSNALFTHIDDLSVNGVGNIGFRAFAGGRRGLWSEVERGQLRRVAQEGDAAPGTPSLVFTSSSFGLKATNVAGQTAFFAAVHDPASPRPRSYNGIWAQDRAGALHLVALVGQLLDVSDDPSLPDLREIRTLSFAREGFSKLGEVAFHAAFTDGSSGIFLSHVAAVPEPTCCALLAALAIAGTSLRRRRR